MEGGERRQGERRGRRGRIDERRGGERKERGESRGWKKEGDGGDGQAYLILIPADLFTQRTLYERAIHVCQ